MNIKTKLSLWYCILFTVLICAFGITANLLLSNSIKKQTVHPWDMHYAVTEQTTNNKAIITGFTGSTENIRDYENSAYIADHYSYKELAEMETEEDLLRIGNILVEKTALDDLPASEDYTIWFYTDISGNLEDVIAVTRSPDDVEILLDQFSKVLILAGAVTLLLACIGGFFLIRYTLRPVQSMAMTVREIEESNLDTRLEYHGNDELGYLASTFNRMLTRLQNAFDREREFTADASHQLRTPLSVIQSEASLTLTRQRNTEEYREALETIYEEAEHMGSVLKRLLFLARYENHGGMKTERIDLKDLLDELTSDIDVLCEEKSIRCALFAAKNIVIQGNKTSLREMFFNIIENAIRYTDEGGEIMVDLTSEKKNAIVSVSDTGIGIPAEHIDHVFERFYRVDRTDMHGSGSGLGLAIAQRIAEFHHGIISVKSKVGEGSIFTVYLPLSK